MAGAWWSGTKDKALVSFASAGSEGRQWDWPQSAFALATVRSASADPTKGVKDIVGIGGERAIEKASGFRNIARGSGPYWSRG